jgi:MerR family mercuric resistance operon transcriptional regulator
MSVNKKLTIGILAKESGVGVETVRFYERRGLIKRPMKKAEAFRQYSWDDVKKISFIKRTQELGFTLKEIQDLLELNSNPRATCSDIQARTNSKIAEVEEKIEDLKRMQKTLRELAGACGESKQAASECRILDCFEPGWKC